MLKDFLQKLSREEKIEHVRIIQNYKERKNWEVEDMIKYF